MWRTDQVGKMQHTYGPKHTQCTQYLHKEEYLHSATHDLHTSNSHLRAGKWQDVHGQLYLSKANKLKFPLFLIHFKPYEPSAICKGRINLMEKKKKFYVQLSSVTKITGGWLGFRVFSITGFLTSSQKWQTSNKSCEISLWMSLLPVFLPSCHSSYQR